MSECPTASRWRDALASIGRRPVAWAATVVMAGLALGAVLMLAIAGQGWPSLEERTSIAPEATVVLASGASSAEVESLRTALSLLPNVASTRFVPRDAALAQIASRTPADRDAIGQLAANPLPDVVVLSFRSGASPDAIEAAVMAIRKISRVDAVELDLGWYRKFWAVARLGVMGTLAVAAALLTHAAGWLTAAVAVAGPIDARHVQLLWLLGADDRVVRRAPVLAAVLTTLSVALIALVAARAGWQWLDRELLSLGRLYGGAARLAWPPPIWLAGFTLSVVLVGVLVGSTRARLRLRAIRNATSRED